MTRPTTDHLHSDDARRSHAKARRLRKCPEELLDTMAPHLSRHTRTVVLDRLRDMPETMRMRYVRAVAGKGPPADAIIAYCLQCVGHDRDEAKRCTSRACPLYHWRPGADED